MIFFLMNRTKNVYLLQEIILYEVDNFNTEFLQL